MTFIQDGLRLTNSAIEMLNKYTQGAEVESVVVDESVLQDAFKHLKNNENFAKDYPNMGYDNFRSAYFHEKIWLDVMKIVNDSTCPVKNKEMIVIEYMGSDDQTAHTFLKMMTAFEGSANDMNVASFEINSAILLEEAFPQYHLEG
jgi:hypothetical protein